MSKVRFIGLDVHADTIAVAVAEPNGEIRPLGVIPNRLESVRKLTAKLGTVNQLKACYEAGPTGYILYWQLTGLGIPCDVVAPSLVAGQSWRSREDGSTRWGQAGALLSRR
jgi:transposase